MKRTVYRCPFDATPACPKVERYAENAPVFQWDGCQIGPLLRQTGDNLQVICTLWIDTDVIQTPDDLAAEDLEGFVIQLPGKEAKE